MLKILELPELLVKRDELTAKFKANKKDCVFLGTAHDALKEIEIWKYSTGPIFGVPPFVLEMAGFDGGRLLKKQYPNPYEARLKGVYSSGFIGEQLTILVQPSKPPNMPLIVSKFLWENDILHKTHIKYFDHNDCKSTKPPGLIGIGMFFNIKKYIRAYIAIGDAGAFSIELYHYDEKNLISSVSSVTAPSIFQNEYQMRYDAEDDLEAIYSGDQVVWKRKGA